MTVKELIDKLQQFDEDKLVLVEDPAGDVLKENDIKRFIKGIENVKVGTKQLILLLLVLLDLKFMVKQLV